MTEIQHPSIHRGLDYDMYHDNPNTHRTEKDTDETEKIDPSRKTGEVELQ